MFHTKEFKQKRNTHVATCQGKEPYRTKGSAILRIKRKMRNHNIKNDTRQGKVLVPYRCPFCHYWHVGSTDRSDLVRGR